MAGERFTDTDADELLKSAFGSADQTSTLMFDVGAQLMALKNQRIGGRWYAFYSVPGSDARQDVLLVDRYHPYIGPYSRVISNSRSRTEDGEKITSADYFVNPQQSRFHWEAGSLLIRPSAERWPIGRSSAPVLRPGGGNIDMVSGRAYDHYPTIPTVTEDSRLLAQLENVHQLLQQLSPAMYEPGYELGRGEF